ncbi:hypothetical protein HN51_066187 [Arachis hypogaea]|uniref:BHLH domain-containing protein n=1 Tax=Arachis hypogaea TaxID=3818 RepID=A0A444ZN27_ARAHY|nr:Transcription factor [Arachis hypogaea]RYR15621.1 hypothetical protein Ahy_B04g072493 [Arachis hypogaea]
MSGQRSSTTGSKLTENEINDLVSRLQVLLPHLNQRTNSKHSMSKILQETCSHIRRLQKEVDDLSERLALLMDSMDISDVDRRVLENFLQQ